MTPAERDTTAAICLFAAMADGKINPPEQARVQAAIRSLAPPDAQAGSDVYQRVMLGQTDVATEAASLTTPDLRRQAYELAVSVCAADGVTSEAEQSFLNSLASALGVGDQHAAAAVAQADQVAAGATTSGPAAPSGHPQPSEAELNDMITSTAITTGALELLPHTLASMAIIPLQMRLVYRLGTRYGYSLDRTSVGEFLGVLGFGATAQVVESLASKLVGGIFGGLGGAVIGHTVGGMVGSLGGAASGAAVSFASTYALGQVAKQYYAGGRRLAAIDLRSVYASNLEVARGLFSRYAPQVQSQARTLNPAQLLSQVTGGVGT
jgi:uncharacterized protein (DUF697 family)/tellurite resistance protein